MNPEKSKEVAAHDVYSLLMHGYRMVGKVEETARTSFHFRHTRNHNRAVVAITPDDAQLIINGEVKQHYK